VIGQQQCPSYTREIRTTDARPGARIVDKDLAHPGVGLGHYDLLEIALREVGLRCDDAAEVEARRRFPTAALISHDPRGDHVEGLAEAARRERWVVAVNQVDLT